MLGDLAHPAKDETEDMSVLEQSGSQRAIENLLKVYYEPLELWFLRMSVEKVRLACAATVADRLPYPTGSPPRLP